MTHLARLKRQMERNRARSRRAAMAVAVASWAPIRWADFVAPPGDDDARAMARDILAELGSEDA